MKSKTFVYMVLSLLLAVMVVVGSINILIDPLFQYHKPWFGLEPVIESERYHIPGIIKTFDYDNVIMGNSLSKNFIPNDASSVFGGKTIKVTANGSLPLDWSYILRLMSNKECIDNVMLNMDSLAFEASRTEFRHELPVYLYDYNYFNDVNYLYNFSIIKEYTIGTVKNNLNNNIKNYDSTLPPDDTIYSREYVLKNYERAEISKNKQDEVAYVNITKENLDLILPYIKEMNDTKFVIFYSPFSMVYWDEQDRTGKIGALKKAYLYVSQVLTEQENVELYLWNDNEMLEIMGDLDNYTDHIHYSPQINALILQRIGDKDGLVTKYNYESNINDFFNYIETYDYDSIYK